MEIILECFQLLFLDYLRFVLKEIFMLMMIIHFMIDMEFQQDI